MLQLLDVAWLRLVISWSCLLAGYAGWDLLLRRGLLGSALRRLGLVSSVQQAWACAAGGLSLGFWLGWPVVGSEAIRLLAAGLSTILAWNAATRDRDPVFPGPGSQERLLACSGALLAWFHPAGALATAALLSVCFRFWQHHATLPMRLLQACCGYLSLSAMCNAWQPGSPLARQVSEAIADAGLFVAFSFVMHVSHYFITSLAKALLGPRWYSWVLQNRTHYLAASAYSWGWGRFLPWNQWLRFVEAIRWAERPLQIGVFAVELLAPLALFDVAAAGAMTLAFTLFHLGVFAVAGLLFWDWILTNLLLFGCLVLLPAPGTAGVFGLPTFLLGLALMAAFPLRHRLWKPMPLGWYDTPLTARIHWKVVGRSGTEYGLYSDFMDPHERLYGRVNGCFATRRTVITYHLGEVWKPELRAAIEAAGPDRCGLDAIRQRFGIEPYCADRTQRHERYLQAFFSSLNSGAAKSVLPTWLRWLKAPGDQLFYWGELPPYRRQEPVAEVALTYREEYFDGTRHVRLVDEEVSRFAVPARVPLDVVPEHSPKELDDYLLGLAAGRLIDLPGFKKAYLRGDDAHLATKGVEARIARDASGS